MALSLMVLSAVFAAISNLCLRKHLDRYNTPQFFILVYLSLTFVVTLWLYPIRGGHYSCGWATLLLGVTCGFALAGMKQMISKALQVGPSGLTFATINSTSVLPGLILILLFSNLVDVEYTIWNGVGSLMVLGGLFWATKGERTMEKRGSWLLFSLAAGLFYLVYLVLSQLLLPCVHYFGEGDHAAWFLPISFGTASLIYILTSSALKHRGGMRWAVLGGVLNGLCAFFFLYSIETSDPFEAALIFPLFTVVLIAVCNVWGQYLYNERINWLANILCFLGIGISAM